jgi:hypothetical protein
MCAENLLDRFKEAGDGVSGETGTRFRTRQGTYASAMAPKKTPKKAPQKSINISHRILPPTTFHYLALMMIMPLLPALVQVMADLYPIRRDTKIRHVGLIALAQIEET